MAKTDAYFQFPINALFLNFKPIDDVTHDEKLSLLDSIIRHTVVTIAPLMVEGGAMKVPRCPFERAAELVDNDSTFESFSGEFDEDDEGDVGRVLACQRLRITPSSSDFLSCDSPFSQISFGSMQVRIRADILWDYWNNKRNIWREFAVLSAVYAALGNKRYSSVSYDRIRSMAMGFNGQSEWESHLMEHTDSRLTNRKTQTTVRKLTERGFFVRCRPSNRNVYYSNRMNESQLIKAITEQEVKRKVRASSVGEKDDEVRRAIAAATAEAKKQMVSGSTSAAVDTLVQNEGAPRPEIDGEPTAQKLMDAGYSSSDALAILSSKQPKRPR